ncbi:MAG: SDR family oxidoreductase [Pseudomonadota bacterium]
MTQPCVDLSGNTALVTGATGYLGQAICRSLGECGARVLVNGRKASAVTAFVETLGTEGLRAEPAIFDIQDREAVSAYVEKRGERPLDILVNNAYAGSGGTIETATPEAFHAALDIGVVAAQNLLQVHLPALRKSASRQGSASVINVVSMYGLVSPDLRLYASKNGSNPPFYGAVKAALTQFTRYAACEFGKEGIRVNAVAPGPFPAHSVQEGDPDFVKRLSERVPMGRIGQAHEIGGPVSFLASAAASYINGAVLSVDGGWTAW